MLDTFTTRMCQTTSQSQNMLQSEWIVLSSQSTCDMHDVANGQLPRVRLLRLVIPARSGLCSPRDNVCEP